jgi:hypothetical protein
MDFPKMCKPPQPGCRQKHPMILANPFLLIHREHKNPG